MKRNWIFWLIRIGIYALIAAILIGIYNANGCFNCPTISDTQSTILLIGKIFGASIIILELVLVIGGRIKKSTNES